MMRKHLLLGLALTCMFAGLPRGEVHAASGTPLVREGISRELGRRDYLNYCAACHGVDAAGDGTLGEFLTLSVPDLTHLSKLNSGKFPAERVMAVIDGRDEVKVHGLRDMPVWGDWFSREAAATAKDAAREAVVDDRIRSLITYLESIQAN